eukprot:scaffold20.g7668.t1
MHGLPAGLSFELAGQRAAAGAVLAQRYGQPVGEVLDAYVGLAGRAEALAWEMGVEEEEASSDEGEDEEDWEMPDKRAREAEGSPAAAAGGGQLHGAAPAGSERPKKHKVKRSAQQEEDGAAAAAALPTGGPDVAAPGTGGSQHVMKKKRKKKAERRKQEQQAEADTPASKQQCSVEPPVAAAASGEEERRQQTVTGPGTTKRRRVEPDEGTAAAAIAAAQPTAGGSRQQQNAEGGEWRPKPLKPRKAKRKALPRGRSSSQRGGETRPLTASRCRRQASPTASWPDSEQLLELVWLVQGHSPADQRALLGATYEPESLGVFAALAQRYGRQVREWTEEEDALLLQLAADPEYTHRRGLHNWKRITEVLGRTSAGQQSRKQWTTSEVQELDQLGSSSERRQEVLGSSELDWAVIGEHFGVSGEAACIKYRGIKHGGGASGEAPQRSTKETSKFLELAVQALLLLPSREGRLADILAVIEQTPRLSDQLTAEDKQPRKGLAAKPRWHGDVMHKLQQANFLRHKEGMQNVYSFNPSNPPPLVEGRVTAPAAP